MDTNFIGFKQSTIDFLTNLKENNNKQWFEANKLIYKEDIIKPLILLINQLSPLMLSIDPLIDTRPVIGKTISRINRDIRFSRDKSPYRSSIWITFKRPIKDWQSSPGFFFEISPQSYRYGMGFYSANRDTMEKFRSMIDNNMDKFKKEISFFYQQQIFIIEGDKYKRILDKSKSVNILEWYQRKNLYLVCNRKIDHHLFNGQIIDDLITGFSQVADFYHYLHKVKDIK